MQRSSVVLPEPLGPITTTTCPRLTERSTPFRTVISPKRLTIFSARTISLLSLFSCCCTLIAIFSSNPLSFIVRWPAYLPHLGEANQSPAYVTPNPSDQVRLLTYDWDQDGSRSSSGYSPKE